MALSKIARHFLSTAVPLSLGWLLALGCASTHEAAMDATSPTSELAEAPPEVVAKLTYCLQQGAARLTSTEFAILLDVTVTDDGKIFYVKTKSSLLGDLGTETCIRSSLMGTSLSAPVMRLRASPRASDGAMAPQDRSLVGNPAVLAAPAIALGPIVLVAAGVTVVVGITIYAMSVYRSPPPKEKPPEKPDCDQVRAQCRDSCTQLHDPDEKLAFYMCVRTCASMLGC